MLMYRLFQAQLPKETRIKKVSFPENSHNSQLLLDHKG